jgi:hypothetical protein
MDVAQAAAVGRWGTRGIVFDDERHLALIERNKPGLGPYWASPGGGVEATDASAEDMLRPATLPSTVRCGDPSDLLRAESYKLKANAERRCDELSAEIPTGCFFDRDASRIGFKQSAETWRALQVHCGATEEQIDAVLESGPTHGPDTSCSGDHVRGRPGVGQVAVDRNDEGRGREAQGATRRRPLRYASGIVSGILMSAVATNRVPANPCAGTRLQRKVPKRIKPTASEALWSLIDAIPEHFRALVLFTARTGPGRGVRGHARPIELESKTLHVDRQLLTSNQQSNRARPRPRRATATSRCPRRHPGPQGHLRKFLRDPPVVFTSTEGAPLRRSTF